MNNLENLLYNTDFSQDKKKKEAIKARLFYKIESRQMKDAKGKASLKARIRRPYAAVIFITVGALIAACSVFYGEDIIKAVRNINIGKHATFVVFEDSRNIDNSAIDIQTRFDYHTELEREKGLVTYFDTIDEAKPYLAFKPLMPVFLPAGFSLDRISLLNDENGFPLELGSLWYLDVHYTNAEKTQQIYMQLRMMDKDSGFTASANSDMRSISINGHEGVVFGNNVIVEIDGIMYFILAGWAESVTQDDVVKMAESLK